MAIGVRGIVVVKQSPPTLGMACAALHECRNVRVNDDVSKFAGGVSTAKMRKESEPTYVAGVVARCSSDSVMFSIKLIPRNTVLSSTPIPSNNSLPVGIHCLNVSPNHFRVSHFYIALSKLAPCFPQFLTILCRQPFIPALTS